MLKMKDKPIHIYKEQQRFTQWWMWAFILLPLGIALYGCYVQFYLATPFGSKPMSNIGLVFFTLFGIAFAGLFWINKLQTRIDDTGIHVRFFPYTKRSFDWGEVEHCEVIPYDFVGGWGIRFWTQYGTVYNVQGGQGLYVQLKNKKKFLVGTQRPQELAQCIAHFESLS